MTNVRLPAFSLRVKAFGTHGECGHGWFRAYSSFRPTPDGCCAPGTGGWVKSRAQRGRGSDAVGALDAAGGSRMMGGQELVQVSRAG
jgi:hypothetical protein